MTTNHAEDIDTFLAAYDEQLRGDAEASSATDVERCGPLYLITLAGGRGLVTYRPFTTTHDELAALVCSAVDYFRAVPGLTSVKWKTRGHDIMPGLYKSLLHNGFRDGGTESIMIGRPELLLAEDTAPSGVTLRRITSAADVRATRAMVDSVFGARGEPSEASVQQELARLHDGTGRQVWVAEADIDYVTSDNVAQHIVGSGRLEPVSGTDFAGIWGGAVVPEWRHRGIYRALTAARAGAALEQGKTLIQSDSTEYSRPILERSGLIKVSTTTPYRLAVIDLRSVGCVVAQPVHARMNG